MFKFSRKLILPLFLERRMTVAALARNAGVAHQSAQRALDGKLVSATIVGKICAALEIDAVKFLEPPSKAHTIFDDVTPSAISY